MANVIKVERHIFPGNEYSPANVSVTRLYDDDTVTQEIFTPEGKLIEKLTSKTVCFNLYVSGEENAKKARDFIGNSCTRGIYQHGKRLAQMEDLDEDLVLIGYIETSANVEKVINQLTRLGFTGLCEIEKDFDEIYYETICAVAI